MRSLAQRHLDERLAFDQHRKRQQAADTPSRAVLPNEPAGRRQLRGIPCVGTGGLDERRNPLLEVLDRERDRETRNALNRLAEKP